MRILKEYVRKHEGKRTADRPRCDIKINSVRV
jgi:hypothetical protein